MINIRCLFQHCCYCGAMVFKNSHLCTKCKTQTLEYQKNNYINFIKLFESHRLTILSLGVYRHPIMAAWIKALKNGDKSDDFNHISQKWLSFRQNHFQHKLHLPVRIVPSPSRKSGKPKDHAYCLAEALAKVTDWELWNPLTFHEISSKSEQKFQKRKSRSKRQFHKIKNRNKIAGTIIFIDDVVTTGNTAKAAYEALNNPLHFEVWCVAYQPLTSLKPVNLLE